MPKGVREDLSGKKFGRLTVIRLAGPPEYGWIVRCECGVEKRMQTGSFKANKNPSCGCQRWAPKGRICSVEGCGRKHRCVGLCDLHYARRQGAKPKPERLPLTTERLRELMTYNAYTGEFVWISKQHTRRRAQCVTNSWGYRVIRADGWYYGAHRLAWLYMMGELPPGDIDHINGDRADNRIGNLRAASRSENMQNLKRAHRDNSTGHLGVFKKRHRFGAQIMVDGVKHKLGTYDTPQEAHEVYLEAKRKLHPAGVL